MLKNVLFLVLALSTLKASDAFSISHPSASLLDISWRENTSAACLASEVWSHELDAARLVYFYALAECVVGLEGQSADTPTEELNITLCERCSSDFLRICDERAGLVSTVDVVFEDQVNSTDVLKKYRFYECIPPECAATVDDANVFTQDWIDDLDAEFDIVQANFSFESPVTIPSEDVPGHNQSDSDSCQTINEFSQECAAATLLLHDGTTDADLADVRNTYINFRQQQRGGVCTCHTLGFDVGGAFTLNEAACICDTHARALEEECLVDAANRRFCYYTMSFRGGPTRRYNYTYFDCIPAECDNPFDRYGLTHAFYEQESRQNAFHPDNARFESFCYDQEQATPFVFSDDCAVDSVDVRDIANIDPDSSASEYNISYEDAYLDVVVECIEDIFNIEPRESNVNGTCTELLEPYNDECANNDRLLCANKLQFDKTNNATFGPQSYEITIYQCISTTCDNDFDRGIFENRDVWIFDGALGTEENGVTMEWSCSEATIASNENENPDNNGNGNGGEGDASTSSSRRTAVPVIDAFHVFLEFAFSIAVLSSKYL